MAKKKTTIDNMELIVKLTQLREAAKRARFTYEPRWYESYNAYENNHFVWFNPETRQIVKLPIAQKKFFNQVPKLTKQIDAIENALTSQDLRWVTYPTDGSEEAKLEANNSASYLENKWDDWSAQGQFHNIIHNALIYPVAWVELTPTPLEGDSDNFDIEMNNFDAFDIFLPPTYDSTTYQNSPYIIKEVKKILAEVKSNPVYQNVDKIIPENRYAGSEYKNLIYSERYGSTAQSTSAFKETDPVILSEFHLRERQENDTFKIRIVTLAGKVLLRNELTDYSDYNFVPLQLHSGNMYQPSWSERILPLNRSLDLVCSRVEDWILKVVKGSYLIRVGSGVKRITNENGEMIYYKGQPPVALGVPAVPAFVSQYIMMLIDFIQEQTVSSATIGKVPKGVKAYKAMELMRQQDYVNLKTALDNLEVFMTKIAQKTLELASKYIKAPLPVFSIKKEEYRNFDVVGETNATAGDWENPQTTVLKAKSKVKVELESGLALTQEGKIQRAMELGQAGLLDKESVLRLANLGDIRDILEKIKSEKFEGKTILDSPEYKALSPQLKMAIVQELQQISARGSQPPQEGQETPPVASESPLEGLTAGQIPPQVQPRGSEPQRM